MVTSAVETQYNEGPRDWQNLFPIKRFHYIKVLFHIFYYYCGKENYLLYQGLHYIEVPLYCIYDKSVALKMHQKNYKDLQRFTKI